MKIQRFTLLATLLTSTTFAQTNTYPFPASGNVGIGTTTPSATLTLTNGDDARLKLYSNGGNIAVIDAVANSNESIGRWLSINPSGANVGIGVTNPSLARLQVLGAAVSGPGGEALWVDNNGVPLVTRREAAGGGTVEVGTPQNHNMAFITNGSPVMFLAPSGNVGIGNTSPVGKLDVSGIPDGSSVFFRSVGRPFLDIKGGVNSYKSLRFSNVGNDNDYRWDLNVLPGNDPTNPDGIGWWNSTTGQIFTMKTNGNVGIGTINPQHKLAVNGTIKAKEVIVETTGWSDYVFAEDYALQPLAQVEEHIKEHKHLPGIPSASAVASNGVNVGAMQAALLAKVEELTLHLIAQEKELSRLRDTEKAVTELRAEIDQLRRSK